MTYQQQLLRHALALAEAGYFVFPLTVTLNEEKPDKKRLYIPFGEVDGWKAESTRDEKQIREWFTEPQKSMKGLAIDCGKSGIVAIDLDVSDTKDGYAEWEKLPEQQDSPMRVRTRTGGLHRFYRDPSSEIRNSADEIAPGIDIRGNGGLVITAPTRVFGTNTQYKLDTDIVAVSDLPALTQPMIDVILSRQATAKPRFDSAINGPFRVEQRVAESMVQERLDRITEGKGYRAAIFGYAAGVAQFEAGKARRDDVEVDAENLRDYVASTILPVVPWESLDDEDLQWIEEGIEKGLAEPWVIAEDVPTQAEEEWSQLTLDELLTYRAPDLPGLPKDNHAGAAPVVTEGLVGKYLFAQGLGWHQWTGDRWAPNPPVPVRNAVQIIINRNTARARSVIQAAEMNHELRDIKAQLTALEVQRGANGEVTQLENDLRRRMGLVDAWKSGWEYFSMWWGQVGQGQNFDHIMKFVQDDASKVFVLAEHMDADPYVLNCPNGTVDLRTGKLREHDQRDLITKTTGVPFDIEAQHPIWDKAREAFAPGIEPWLQKKIGEGAFGFPTADDTMIFNFGGGSNGKSTVTDAILYTMGDYAVFLHDKAILGKADDHGTEKMVFKGARWAILEELPEARVLEPAKLKKLVGTAKITARLMRQDNVTFDATHSLMINSNHRPQILENDRGTWRRLVSIPWPYTFKFAGEKLTEENDRWADPRVKRGLKDNMEVRKAALAWIVRGAVYYYQAGNECGELPAIVRSDTDSWRRESDIFGTFFEENLEVAPGFAVSTKELLDVYNDYLLDLGKQKVSDTHIVGKIPNVAGAGGVDKKVVRQASKTTTVSKRAGQPLPSQFTAWVGIRWKGDSPGQGF